MSNEKRRISNVAHHTKKASGPYMEGRKLIYQGPIKVSDLARLLKLSEAQIIKNLFMKGQMVTINNVLSPETVAELCLDFNFDYDFVEESDDDCDFGLAHIVDNPKDLKPRPPVVTIMGHVDHGKTTLIDAIRSSSIVSGEAGSITQAIGAYQKEINGKKITFIDTPGHEAFTAMRSRGTKVTDIVILVVAADDGVMPQTIEAIDHARAAEVPIIVAVNKMDKPSADLQKVKNELLAQNVIAEEYGGDVIFQPISAKKGTGIEQLLDAILVTAEMLELHANPRRYAYGTVLEARLERGEGPKATLLIQNGTLTNRDFVVAGAAYGKVRRMTNEHNKALKSAGPATPVAIIGLDEVPEAGDNFIAFETEKEAKELATKRKQIRIEESRGSSEGLKLSDLHKQIAEGETVVVNVIIKADNSGSAEAVRGSLEKINIDGVRLNIIRASAGQITESDVLLASASNAVIFGFNIRPNNQVRDLADRLKIEIHLHRVIYALLEQTEKALRGLLKPEFEEKVTGQAEVRAIWHASKVGTIAGCYMLSGIIRRDQTVRLLRDGVIIYEGEVATMKHVKNDVKESRAGYECGMTLLNYNDIKEGDIIEGFAMVEVKNG
ncbi:MAG: Translation initiation factor IF-2 [Tenericutes bacterium ADurb.Bin239]|jgi:translation initiation factor IF-2|nr:MAG: Translation initiation factor IF-2 [Tenericutes bacterium ADurb.Bin239]